MFYHKIISIQTSILSELGYQNNTTGDDSTPFFHSNETGYEKTIKKLTKAKANPNAQVIHLGVSGMQNLDIIAARSSNLAIIIDRNSQIQSYFLAIKRILLLSDTTKENFHERLIQELKPTYPFRDKHSQYYYLKNGLKHDNSWINTNAKFEHIRKLFQEDRIVIFRNDYSNPALFSTIKEWADTNSAAIDSIYFSNLYHYLTSSDKELFFENLKQVSNPKTFLIGGMTSRVRKARRRSIPRLLASYY